MPLFIRDAEATDMEDLQGVFRRASLSNENDRGPLREHPEWLVLSDQGVQEGRTRVAVDEDGTVTGFATHLLSDGVVELEDLFVDPPRMRQGIAAALVLDIYLRLNQLGFERLEVTANPHAMPFYEHLGFLTDKIVDTPGYPAPRMSRPTNPPDRESPSPGSRGHPWPKLLMSQRPDRIRWRYTSQNETLLMSSLLIVAKVQCTSALVPEEDERRQSDL